jgi:hypothetical protein
MRSSTLTILGIILIVGGAVGLFYRAIPYTSRDVILDVGPLTATADTQREWPVSPILGGAAIALGTAFIAFGVRKT